MGVARRAGAGNKMRNLQILWFRPESLRTFSPQGRNYFLESQAMPVLGRKKRPCLLYNAIYCEMPGNAALV